RMLRPARAMRLFSSSVLHEAHAPLIEPNSNPAPDFLDPIFLIDLDNFRLVPFQLFFVVMGVAKDDHLVPYDPFASGRTVQADRPGASLARQNVGDEPLPVIEIGNHDLL